MSSSKDVPRPQKERPRKPPAKSNAEKLKEYKARIKANPVLYSKWKAKKKVENQRRQASLTDEQKSLEREKARLRQQQYRARKKEAESKVIATPRSRKTKRKKPPTSQCMTREHFLKVAEKREANRLRQQKYRAGLSAQRKKLINERRRERYLNTNNNTVSISNPKARIRLDILLRAVQSTLNGPGNKTQVSSK